MKNWLNSSDISGSINEDTYESALAEVQEAAEKGYIIINGRKILLKNPS